MQLHRPRPIVVDAHNLCKRGIMATALDDLKAGETFTGGVLASLTLLTGILKQPDFSVSNVYCFFDHGVPPARIALLPDYKKRRNEQKKILTDEQKEKAYIQIDICREMFSLLGVVCAAYRDREADDAVAAAVRVLVAQKQRPIVVSADKDLLQCVNMGASVWNFKHLIEPDNFSQLVPVDSKLYLLYKVLIGDPSDGIEGVPGCGPVRAEALLKEFVHLYPDFKTFTPYKQLDELHGMVKTKGSDKDRMMFENAFLAQKARLVNVMKAVDLSNSFGKCEGLKKKLDERPKPDQLAFLRFAARYRFNSVLGAPSRYFMPFSRASQNR